MSQRHALGPPRASTGVKDQGNVVRSGLGGRTSSRSIRQVNVALLVHFHGEDRDLTIGGSSSNKFRTDGRTKQNASASVSEEKMKFLVGICRIQRRRRPSDGCGQKADD